MLARTPSKFYSMRILEYVADLAGWFWCTTDGSAGTWDSGTLTYNGAQNIASMGGLRLQYDKFLRMTRGDVDLGTGVTKTQTVTFDRMGNINQLRGGEWRRYFAPGG